MDADAAIARVQQQVAQAQEQAVRAQAMKSEIDALRVTASDPRRRVSVTVDASGRLIDVELANSAYDVGAAELGRLLVQTANEAQRDAGAVAIQIAADTFGEDSAVVDHLRDELEAMYPAEEEDDRG